MAKKSASEKTNVMRVLGQHTIAYSAPAAPPGPLFFIICGHPATTTLGLKGRQT